LIEASVENLAGSDVLADFRRQTIAVRSSRAAMLDRHQALPRGRRLDSTGLEVFSQTDSPEITPPRRFPMATNSGCRTSSDRPSANRITNGSNGSQRIASLTAEISISQHFGRQNVAKPAASVALTAGYVNGASRTPFERVSLPAKLSALDHPSFSLPLPVRTKPHATDPLQASLQTLLRYVHHRPRPWDGKFLPILLKAIDDLLNDFPKLLIHFDGIVTVNSGD
jgi:hypothetical protein